MPQTMNSLYASSTPTKTFETLVVGTGVATEATSVESPCVVFRIEDRLPKIETPAHHKTIDQLVDKWSKDEKRREALQQARHWVADKFHGEDGETVRTLRLKKGWSQVQLATELSTSQSHIARIERGTENLAIETCRKLCVVLGVDMNTLDAALHRQEALVKTKVK
ncbi:transcriptional regulator [Methylomonas methanica]|uniref:Transcriptional regulator n=1 Tax=Methylomonas methanica TaxID=421 RepID=A0A177MMD9_METMH|nr:transcriptional regulator [Methylomonas methanica]